MLARQALSGTRRCPIASAESIPLHAKLRTYPLRSTLRKVSTASIAEPLSVAASAAPATPGFVDLLTTGARLTAAAQTAWAQVLRPGDTAVDATCGNGHDTLFLAQAVGPNGHVYGFDIQEAALASTRQRVESCLPVGARARLSLLHGCHSGMREVCGSGAARVVVFNLGYLPGTGDKAVTTRAASTLAAVEAATEVVSPGGLISILAYVGHPGGQEEYEAVRGLVGRLGPAHWVASETRLLNLPTAPILLLVWRREPTPRRTLKE